MKFTSLLPLVCAALALTSCKSTKQTTTEVRNLPELNIRPSDENAEQYRAAFTVQHNILHTALDVRFDWTKKYLYGKAVLTVRPHFYPSNRLILNARGMQILDVRILKGGDSVKVNYEYPGDSLYITTDKMYTKSDTFQVYINYIAKPDELKDINGSHAITSDKGLYFINADGKDKSKPRQIWTQGETQANSVWFPTIDAPNQKMTEEIKITIDSSFKTLSNGIMVSSKNNGDGTRTDIWKQDLPHSPYLVMMAIGQYAVVKDSWRNREVSYYVEPEYERVARKIFGNTPEMIEFFSQKTGVDYPWAKYSQVTARDYVSGAMENTTATLHGEFLQRDERELLDETNEDVISHELFHHWFGDYVTCESWSNIPLNESFATYGEYLWNEYKYGRELADVGRMGDLSAYLRESKSKKVDLIRFYYDKQEDMFDRHSYQKGGCILHMLRYVVGDDAFFASLKLYLETNKFKNVEAHHLRLAFEEVTGQDLNWFFNEWFFNKSHPIFDITYAWDESAKTASVTIQQMQDLTESPLYRMPLAVDIYTASGKRRESITVSKKAETFTFNSTEKPQLINVDAEKMLVGVRNDKHSNEEWITMYHKAPLFQDRFDALQALSKDFKAGTPEALVIVEALKDKNWKLREFAIGKTNTLLNADNKESIKKILMDIGRKDPKADVRDAALTALDENFTEDELSTYFKNAVNDSSFAVMSTALLALASRDKVAAMNMGASLEGNKHERIGSILSSLYAKYGSDVQADYMDKALSNSAGFGTYGILQQYGKFIQRCKEQKNIDKGLLNIYNTGKTAENWVVRLAAVQALAEYGNFCVEQAKTAAKAGDATTETMWNNTKNTASKYLDEIKKNETNEMLLKIYNSGK